jgi:Zn-dependent protease with chaperone function
MNPREAVYLVLATTILLLPLIFMTIRFLSLIGSDARKSGLWLKHCQANHMLRLVVVPTWCALWELRIFNNLPDPIFWFVPIGALALAEARIHLISRRVLKRRWTLPDIFRLTVWGTACPTISLLLAARGVHATLHGRLIGLLWFLAAAAIALVGTLRLQSAQGMKLRRVKSGTLFARALHLSRRVGAKIERVYVVPAGRGQLTNAYASWRGIALTDNFGEYLRGPELDSVIAHELAHVQGRHIRKKIFALTLIVLSISLLSFGIPSANLPLRAVFMLFALLAVLLFNYYVSRRFEYACDRKAVEFTNSPEAEIRALVAMYEKTNAPTDCGRFLELFMTHPSLIHRVEAVAQQAGISPAQLSEFLPQCAESTSERGTIVP